MCLIIGIEIMYETRAFWGKESNQNINTINNTMNFMSATNILPIVVTIVIFVLAIGLMMGVRGGFG